MTLQLSNNYKFAISICPLYMGEKRSVRESKQIVKSKLKDAFMSIGVVSMKLTTAYKHQNLDFLNFGLLTTENTT